MTMMLLSVMIPVLLTSTSSTTTLTVDAQSTPTVAPLLEDNVQIRNNIPGRDNVRVSFSDSYSDGGSCYCSISTFDHGIGNVVVNTPLGILTIRQLCNILGDGPRGPIGRPLYNDIQCGNGPPNNIINGDEGDCPGRVEYGSSGCSYIGPQWNFTSLLSTERPTPSPVVRRTNTPLSTMPTMTTPTSNSQTPATLIMSVFPSSPSTRSPTASQTPETIFLPSSPLSQIGRASCRERV